MRFYLPQMNTDKRGYLSTNLSPSVFIRGSPLQPHSCSFVAKVPPRPRRVLLLAPPGDALYIRDNYCSYVAKTRSYWSPIDLLVTGLAPKDAAPLVDVPTPRWTWMESTTLAKSPKFEK